MCKRLWIYTLLLEAEMKSARRLEAFQFEGVVDHSGQLGVEQVLALLVVEPGVDQLVA